MPGGILQLETPDQVTERLDRESVVPETDPRQVEDSLAAHVRKKFQQFRNFRSSEKFNDRYLFALRTYKGQYDSTKLSEIRSFGGSEVFSRLTSIKCRGATALLRDIFLGTTKAWEVFPTPVPELPTDIVSQVDELVVMEAMNLQQQGMQVPPDALEARRSQLYDAAFKAAYRQAKDHAARAEKKLADILVEGKFEQALIDFLTDLPIFPYACIKGPVVQNTIEVKWIDGMPQTTEVPRMFWYRVSPFDIYFSAGVNDIDEAEIIERLRYTRPELQSLIGVKGFNDENIRAALKDYETGRHENLDPTDAERADLEHREDPAQNTQGVIDGLELHGYAPGQLLLDYGLSPEEITEPEKDYSVSVWLVGKYVIKAQINPNPRKRHPYYISSFEKVPGSLTGHGLPEIIGDVQEVANACLRSLVNNLSIASGPQVVVNEDRLSPTCDTSLYPWKRWRVVADPMATSTSEKPVDFFQPQSNSQELLGVYAAMQNISDETSGIPRYMTGSEKVSGAASTASGLSMLMGNASKVLQSVAASIDRDIMEPLLQDLYLMVMLTDQTGMLQGDEKIVVKGVNIALAKDAERMRRLEFLQMTANPIDMGIVGPEGRAQILRELSHDLGMDGAKIVPTDEELMQRMAMNQAMAQQSDGGQGQRGQPQGPSGPGGAAPQRALDNNSRTRTPTAVARQAGGGPQAA